MRECSPRHLYATLPSSTRTNCVIFFIFSHSKCIDIIVCVILVAVEPISPAFFHTFPSTVRFLPDQLSYKLLRNTDLTRLSSSSPHSMFPFIFSLHQPAYVCCCWLGNRNTKQVSHNVLEPSHSSLATNRLLLLRNTKMHK